MGDRPLMGAKDVRPWFLLATGPSQNQADIDRIRGLGTVVAINNAVFMAPWADILYACDDGWWETYGKKIPPSFTGKKLTISPYGYRYGAKKIPHEHSAHAGKGFGLTAVRTGGNSGFQALNYAILKRPSAICLLGYDHKKTDEKAHCHPDHPKGLGNAGAVDSWLKQIEFAGRDTRGVPVVNCSRETAITVFRRMTLEDFISEHCDTNRLP